MKVDYTPYLGESEDGRIWWRLEDAIKLGAGFTPRADDSQNLVPVLRAPNNRVRANERTLIGAFSDARLNIAKPITFERDGFRYVDAAGFLEWLSQYVCRTQAKIEFSNELVSAVRVALDKADAERPPNTPKEFVSLTLALEDWFDKGLNELSDTLRLRVENDFFPLGWVGLSSEQRRSFALQWDYQHDPVLKERRAVDWQESVVDWDYWKKVPLLSAQEFCILRHVHDPRNFEGEKISIPGGVGKPLAERVSNDLRVIDRSLGGDTKSSIKNWVIWAHQYSWDIPVYLRFLVKEDEARQKPKGHLNHDPEMQKRANEIAADKKKEKKGSVTRNEVGKLLAQKLGMDQETVIRRIRKEW